MTMSEKKRIELMEKQIEQMRTELKELKKKPHNEFELLETDELLVEAYN
ncbi:hypothetical protein [Alkalicoccobacillus plakortidis]|uniref:Fur-regulated basic protein B n=1 Tax=Alkalicoccobacillus plakortidis TaxID=444060 RepID=A0ABT0XNG6_9BACI|nr:hypothetical protein [Alkalicoccobacillus plakortidis]MCM2676782.1 hypothetical protein [Alkalicoccobacillus plakortidis]